VTGGFDLDRFVVAQDPVFAQVRAELADGRKQTHWMWYIFPQIAGLGMSAMSRRYAISGQAEAAAYLAHPMLGPRLLACTALVALLVTRGRLVMSTELGVWLAQVEALPRVKFVPMDHEIAILAITLPENFHRDPVDRIIVATARKFGAPIITADEKIRAYRHVRTIW
jgi:predicted nucleic acid-binding protein